MQRLAVLILAIATGAAAGCGSSEQQRQQEAAQQVAKGAEQAAKAAESGAAQAAKGLEQMAKGLESMASGAGGGDTKPVDPVSFRDLQTLFPDLDGWEKAKPTGERMTAPFAFSQAEVRYNKGDARVEIKIVDSGFNQLLFTPFAMFMQAGYEKETSNGYEKSTTVGGQPGWEKWNTEGKDGEVNAFVGKRYILTVEGRNVEDIKVLHDVVGKIDLARLAAMK
jgi:type II secretory pathway pseudopilin PulG